MRICDTSPPMLTATCPSFSAAATTLSQSPRAASPAPALAAQARTIAMTLTERGRSLMVLLGPRGRPDAGCYGRKEREVKRGELYRRGRLSRKPDLQRLARGAPLEAAGPIF